MSASARSPVLATTGWLLGVLVAALAVRLAILWSAADLPLRIVDEQHYVRLATSIHHGLGFAREAGHPTSIRPPLYPYLIHLVWSVAGSESLLAVRVVQIVLSLLNVWLVWLLGAELFGRAAGGAAAALYALYPTLVGFDFLILTEVTFNVLLTLAVVAGMRALRGAQAGPALAAGIALGAAALTRAVAGPFVVAFVLVILLGARGGWGRRALLALTLLAGFAATVGPWAVRNTVLQRVPTLVSSMGGLILFYSNYEGTPLERAWSAVGPAGFAAFARQYRAEHPRDVGSTEGERAAWAKQAAWRFIASHPALTIKRSLVKLADLWGLERVIAAGWQRGWYRPPKWAMAGGTLLLGVGFPVVALLGVVGMLLARGGDWRFLALTLLIIGAMSAIHGLIYGHSRYHLPAIPMLSVYAGATIAQRSWRALWRPGARAITAWAITVLLVAVWVREILWVERARIGALLERLG